MKPFLTYEQQIEKLVLDKDLIVNDKEFAKQKLCEIGYFSLIGGYKAPFRNSVTSKYEKGTTFEDIYALYEFDNKLRELVFKYLCVVERKLRSIISYSFCETYGEAQNQYLDTNNYDYVKKKQAGINKLVNMLQNMACNNNDYEYIVHQRTQYSNVPLWVLINALTFGQISKMYSFMHAKVKSKISKNYTYVNERQLEQFLKVLVLYRNVCAHNERLYSRVVYSEIPDTKIHSKLGIALTGTHYNQGKKDLFSVVIAFRYLLKNDEFKIFKKEFTAILDKYVKKSSRISEDELLAQMGFPANWRNITRYKL